MRSLDRSGRGLAGLPRELLSSVVDAVHADMFTSPDPTRNGTPTSVDLARSAIVRVQFSSPVKYIAISLFQSGSPVGMLMIEARTLISLRFCATPAKTARERCRWRRTVRPRRSTMSRRVSWRSSSLRPTTGTLSVSLSSRRPDHKRRLALACPQKSGFP